MRSIAERRVIEKHEFIASAVLRACVNGLSGIARVTVLGDVGYLFFRKGEIVHARTLDLEDETAALAILSWSEGTFELCERRWPSGPEIGIPWRELLARASDAGTPAHVKALRPAEAPVSSPPETRVREPTEPNAQSRDRPALRPAVRQVSIHWGPALLDDQRVNEYLCLGPDGSVLGERRCSDSLRRTVVHGFRYADEIGALLSAGPAIAVEARLGGAACVLIRNGGETLGLRSDASPALAAIQRACGF